MTSEEISALPDRELDAAIARGTGWAAVRFSETPSMDRPCPKDWYGTPPYTQTTSLVPFFHDSLDACHEAEKRLVEMGPDYDLWFVAALEAIEGPHRFAQIHAPARHRAEAILAAIQKEKPNE